MLQLCFRTGLLMILVVAMTTGSQLMAQDPCSQPSQPQTGAATSASLSKTPENASQEKILVPMGTRLPLLLRNGINTRAAKVGDSIYFETAYPIAANNRMAIPLGTFVRGEILEAKRPGRIRGRGEFRIVLNQMTFPNGYVVDLRATPSSVDRDGQEKVTPEGRVTGPGGVGKDVGTVLLATAVGGPVGGYTGLLTGSPSRGSLAIGHGVGAATGLAIVLLTRGPEAELPRGTMMDVVFDRPLILDAASLPTNGGPGIDPQPRYAPAPLDARQRQKELQKKRVEQSLLRSFLFPHF